MPLSKSAHHHGDAAIDVTLVDSNGKKLPRDLAKNVLHTRHAPV